MPQLIKKITSGRLRRLPYFIGTIFISLLATCINVIYFSEYENYSIINFVWLAAYSILTIKRLHDIGLSGYWSLINFIGFFNILFAIISIPFNLILLFKGSEKVDNKYGKIPSPNLTTMESIFDIKIKKEENRLINIILITLSFTIFLVSAFILGSK